MIADLAVIVATYAVFRLLLEYVIAPDLKRERMVVALIAVGIIVLFTASILSNAGSLSDL
jgi:prolipoprotein diacylglyceryltransferase